MRVILISGKARHGKDTVAGYMRDYLHYRLEKSVLIAHYADLVKYVCRTFFEWDGAKDKHGRTLLQSIGTDIVRKQDPDFWARFLSEILSFFPDQWDYVIIPDTRFNNEIECLKNAGFPVIHMRVDRPCFDNGLTEEQKRHISETALDDVKPDITYVNRGSLSDIYSGMESTCELIESIFKEKEHE